MIKFVSLTEKNLDVGFIGIFFRNQLALPNVRFCKSNVLIETEARMLMDMFWLAVKHMKVKQFI